MNNWWSGIVLYLINATQKTFAWLRERTHYLDHGAIVIILPVEVEVFDANT